MSITLAQAKEYRRIDSSDEDDVLQALVDASWQWILRYIKSDGTDLSPDDLKELHLAQRLLIGDWDHHREASSERGFDEAPFAVHAICGPFRTPTVA